MSSRTDRDWKPTRTGDTIKGTAVDLMIVPTTQSGDVAVLVIEEEDTSDLVGVWITRTVLKRAFAEQRPAPGSRVGIRYKGERKSKTGRTYHHYLLVATDKIAPSPLGWVSAFIRALGRDVHLPDETDYEGPF